MAAEVEEQFAGLGLNVLAGQGVVAEAEVEAEGVEFFEGVVGGDEVAQVGEVVVHCRYVSEDGWKLMWPAAR